MGVEFITSIHKDNQCMFLTRSHHNSKCIHHNNVGVKTPVELTQHKLLHKVDTLQIHKVDGQQHLQTHKAGGQLLLLNNKVVNTMDKTAMQSVNKLVCLLKKSTMHTTNSLNKIPLGLESFLLIHSLKEICFVGVLFLLFDSLFGVVDVVVESLLGGKM